MKTNIKVEYLLRNKETKNIHSVEEAIIKEEDVLKLAKQIAHKTFKIGYESFKLTDFKIKEIKIERD